MTSIRDMSLDETEALLRKRLAQLADHAPTTVHSLGEVPVVGAERPARDRRRRFGVVAAVTALIGAGGFTTYSFLGAADHGGATSPEEAVSLFVSAIQQEDVLGTIEVTLPEEVSVLRNAVDSITADAKRTDLLGDDFDSAAVKGLDVSVDGLTLETNFLEGGLAIVTATGGTLNASLDPAAFPFGDKVRELLDDGQGAATASMTLGGTDPRAVLMTVEREGRWYVSLEYTLAEYARRAAGWELPAAVTRTLTGFASPEEAVTGFYARLAALDLQGAIDTFAPGEDAVAWLAPLWMSNARAAIDAGRAEGWSVAISGLTYDSIGEGDQRTLTPVTFTVEGTTPSGFNTESSEADPSLPTVVSAIGGSEYAVVPPGPVPATSAGLTFTAGFPQIDGGFNFTVVNEDGTIKPIVFPGAAAQDPQPFKIERKDGCTTFVGAGATSMFGIDSTPGAKPVDGGYQVCGDNDSSIATGLFLLAGGLTELPPVSVVQTGGKWYVSPLGTALATATTGLHGMKDGASLFDSPLAPFLYGGLSRSSLESIAVGRTVDSIDPACLPALTVDGAVVTGVIADPQVDAVRACFGASFGASSSAAVAPIVQPVPASSVP